jgi:hypothetical protein
MVTLCGQIERMPLFLLVRWTRPPRWKNQNRRSGCQTDDIGAADMPICEIVPLIQMVRDLVNGDGSSELGAGNPESCNQNPSPCLKLLNGDDPLVTCWWSGGETPSFKGCNDRHEELSNIS